MSLMKKGGQLELLALINTVLRISWKETEQGKLSWQSVAHIQPLQISFLLIDLLPPLFKSWFCSILPVEVSCRGFIAASTMFLLSNITLSKKTQTLTIMFLQKKLEAAFNCILESSPSS